MLFALILNTQINKSTYPSLPFHSLPCFSLPPPLSCLLFLHKIKSFVHFISSLCVFVLRRIQRCIIPLNGPSKQAIGLHPCKLPVSQHSSACIQVFILWEDSSEGWIPPLLCVWSDFITRSGKMLSSDGVWSQRLLSAQTHLERDVEALQQQIHQPSPRGPLWKVFCLKSSGVSVGELLRSGMQQVASPVFSEHPKRCWGGKSPFKHLNSDVCGGNLVHMLLSCSITC